jgi:hypothetical protein
MFNALVVGDGTAIVKFGFPINHVKFNGAVYTYECYLCYSIRRDCSRILVRKTDKEGKQVIGTCSS